MTIEQERTEFEAWYRLHHGSRDVYWRDVSGEYVDKQVQGAFNVWQARAALTAQPAAATKAPGDEGASMTDHWCKYCNGVNAHNCQFNQSLPRAALIAAHSKQGEQQ